MGKDIGFVSLEHFTFFARKLIKELKELLQLLYRIEHY